MNAAFLVLILAAFSGIAAVSEAQTVKNEGLNAKQEGIVTIAAFTAKGDSDKLKEALNEGLDSGLTVNEIKEILVQMYAYTGFPRSLNGIGAFMSVMEERQKKGIKDEPGREPSPLPANKSRLELGTEIQTKLIGSPASGAIYTFAPAIDAFLKETPVRGHLWTRQPGFPGVGKLRPFPLWPAWKESIRSCRPISTSGSMSD